MRKVLGLQLDWVKYLNENSILDSSQTLFLLRNVFSSASDRVNPVHQISCYCLQLAQFDPKFLLSS